MVTPKVAFIRGKKCINLRKKIQSFFDKNFLKFPIFKENERETKQLHHNARNMNECGKKIRSGDEVVRKISQNKYKKM